MDLQAINEYGKHDPVWWISTVLGIDLWEEQIKIVLGVRDHEETAAKSCHGIGKSTVSACILLWFLYCFSPSTVISTAPSDRQVKGILWGEVRKLHANAKIAPGGILLTQKLIVDDDAKHFAMGFTTVANNPERFQGWHNKYILAIVDEAAGVSPQIFEEGVSAILASGDITRLLMIGNPTIPAGEFFKAFKDPETARISVSAFETPNFTEFGLTLEDFRDGTWKEKITGPLPRPYLVKPSWVAKRLKRWGENNPLFRARVLAEFPKQGEDTLMNLDWIDNALERRETNPWDHPLILGVDVARFGSDESVIAWRRGMRVGIHSGYRGLDTRQLSDKVIEIAVELAAREIKVDGIGVGAGVVDNLKHSNVLQEIGCRVLDCVASAAPSGEHKNDYVNAKAEWYCTVRDHLQAGELEIEADADGSGEEEIAESLEGQLAFLRYKIVQKDKIQIVPKDVMKKEGYGSPDRAEAMIMTFAGGASAEIVAV